MALMRPMVIIIIRQQREIFFSSDLHSDGAGSGEVEDDFYDPFGEDNQPDSPPSVAPPSSPPTESPCTPVPPSSATVRQPPATGNQQHGQDSPVVSIFCRRRPVLASQQPCGSRRRPQRTREEKLDDFLQKGCGCRTECYKQITREH